MLNARPTTGSYAGHRRGDCSGGSLQAIAEHDAHVTGTAVRDLGERPGTDTLAAAVTLPNGQVSPRREGAALVNELDALNVAIPLGRAKAHSAHETAGGMLAVSATVWSAALKFRRTRATPAGQIGGQHP
jgi:hypothetical protein